MAKHPWCTPLAAGMAGGTCDRAKLSTGPLAQQCPRTTSRPAQEPWKLTRNQELNIMHVANASHFLATTDHHLVRGDTLVFDFVFFMHPVCAGQGGGGGGGGGGRAAAVAAVVTACTWDNGGRLHDQHMSRHCWQPFTLQAPRHSSLS